MKANQQPGFDGTSGFVLSIISVLLLFYFFWKDFVVLTNGPYNSFFLELFG